MGFDDELLYKCEVREIMELKTTFVLDGDRFWNKFVSFHMWHDWVFSKFQPQLVSRLSNLRSNTTNNWKKRGCLCLPLFNREKLQSLLVWSSRCPPVELWFVECHIGILEVVGMCHQGCWMNVWLCWLRHWCTNHHYDQRLLHNDNHKGLHPYVCDHKLGIWKAINCLYFEEKIKMIVRNFSLPESLKEK